LVAECAGLRDTYMGNSTLRPRDRLLGVASFQPAGSRELVDQIRRADESGATEAIMGRLFKHYGIVIDEAGKLKHALMTEYMTQ